MMTTATMMPLLLRYKFSIYLFLGSPFFLFWKIFHQSFSFISVHKSLSLISHKKLSKYLLKYISCYVFCLQINFDAFKNYIFHVEAYTNFTILWTFVAFFPLHIHSHSHSTHSVYVSVCVCVRRIHFNSLMMWKKREKNVQRINNQHTIWM